ncbi:MULTISPECIES: hypothetical protein [unclassified Moorena]|uniref:hypothetical protein n=1 Tax=unclassified Moorena TaxID=2683338 RepID=UPI0013B65357|nr:MULTISPECIES: hypothetical protein [unclassified Moorena]NEQ10569.1 hypothetical protein [Moorena sp. SIO4E2]NER91011.1 hypothetical protein [Moorena sp. SIO3A2]NET68027.1 hypothetical protein [Moorena sp. SIO1G6]
MSIIVWWNRLPACVNNCVVEQASSLCQAQSTNNIVTGLMPVLHKMPVPLLEPLARCQFHF